MIMQKHAFFPLNMESVYCLYNNIYLVMHASKDMIHRFEIHLLVESLYYFGRRFQPYSNRKCIIIDSNIVSQRRSHCSLWVEWLTRSSMHTHEPMNHQFPFRAPKMWHQREYEGPLLFMKVKPPVPRWPWEVRWPQIRAIHINKMLDARTGSSLFVSATLATSPHLWRDFTLPVESIWLPFQSHDH